MNRNSSFESKKATVAKGLIAGVIGGLVGSWTMDRFQAVWIDMAERMEKNNGGKSEKPGEEQEPATVKAAQAFSEHILNHELTREEKKYAGPAVHYATGAGLAAIYGVTAEFVPEVTVGAGLPFGTAVWLLVDEMAVPALGLAKPAGEYPLSTHVYALASHFVYGVSTEITRRVVRSAL